MVISKLKARKGSSCCKSEYPRLAQGFNGLIVLLTGDSTGVVVHPNSRYNIGHRSKKWAESSMNNYKGELVLSNEGG